MRRTLYCGALGLLFACSDGGPQVATYVVAYHLTKTPEASALRCDSLAYENAQGQLIKVTNPALPWAVAFSAPSGSFVQASAWITATAGGQTATLKTTWTITGVSTAADSSVGVSSGAGAFTVGVSRRQL
jgi:hypothetical protein